MGRPDGSAPCGNQFPMFPMTLANSLRIGSLLVSVGAAGCTTTVSAGTGTAGTGTGPSCSLESSAGCGAGASGYACRGGATPEQSRSGLSCSAGRVSASGATLYCCVDVAFMANTCGPDAAVTGCAQPSIGFSCTSSNRPEQTDPSLLCSTEAVPGPSGSTLYCCSTAGAAAAACAPDASVACTTAGATGYTCTGGGTPPAPLACGAGVPEGGDAIGYCCASASTTAACAPDTSVICTTAGATGYTCTGGATPSAPLNCGAGAPEGGNATGYCCTTSTTPSSTCAPSGSVSCSAGFDGYSCSGQDTPWQAVPSLLCQPSGGTGGYCCVSSANSCVEAPAITDCPPPYYGVRCSGADMASTANAALLCAADPNGGLMDFCCSAR